jgi:colanic acid/amylovoran biosynthesis glycosyltransferase
MSAKRLLIFRREFLPVSETFIADHIRYLREWTAAVACEQLIDSDTSRALTPVVAGRWPPQKWTLRHLGKSKSVDRLITESKARLIHCHFLTDAAVIVRYAKRHGLPLVITAHGYDATTKDEHLAQSDLGRLYLARRAEIIAGATKIVCISQFILDELLKQGFPEEKLVCIPLGIDAGMMAATSRAEGRRGMLAVGRLVEKKGHRYLLEAWARVGGDLAREGLTVIGDGPLRGELEAFAAERNLNVRFEGARPREHVLTSIAAARAFVFPSVRAESGDSEGMPIVLMEAQALGTPVICFDLEPMRGGVAEGETALLARHKDAVDLAAQMTALASDADLARRLGEGGPRLVEARFDLARNTSRLEALYDAIAADVLV